MISFILSGQEPDCFIRVSNRRQLVARFRACTMCLTEMRGYNGSWLRTGKTSFLPEEREWLSTLQATGLEDCFRRCHPDVSDRYSWFDYRSKGFDREPKRGLRIDLLLASSGLVKLCTDSEIAYDIRAMEKPSDHCPIWADYDLTLA